jgi:HlyD family secretion protein
MKKIIWIVIAGVLFLVLIFMLKQCSGKKETEVSTEKVGKRNITESVSANGKIQPEVELKISSDVSGEIVDLFVKEGDHIKKGDLLCKINPLIYESSMNRMVATLNATKANYANSVARLEQVKANANNVELSFKRNKKLMEQGAISQSEFDAAKAAYEGAVADVKGAEESVKAAEYNVKSTEASLKEANDNLAKTSIFSPVDGTVSKLNKERGERVVGTAQMEGTEIMRLANLNEMEVRVDVNENDIVRVHIGDTAMIDVDAYLDRKFKGIVTQIANSANTTGVTTDQVTNFTVKIRILQDSYRDLLTANSSPFRPGMSATVDVQTKKANSVLSVPIQAVTTRSDSTEYLKMAPKEQEEGQDGIVVNDEKNNKNTNLEDLIKVNEVLFLMMDGKAKLINVKTGIQDNNYIQITEGLKEGDEIITGPYGVISKQLRDGMEVKKVDKSELFNVKTK